MVFSTPLFLFCFLPLTLLVYYLSPLRWRNAVLLLFSLLFYFWGERIYTLIMLASTVVDYSHGMLVDRFRRAGKQKQARWVVASSMVFNLAILLFFKYWDLLAGSLQSIGLSFVPVLGIHLPIGISFYTFQTMSYTVDVYRGDAELQRNPITFGSFVTLFPQLIAGPIIKYKELGTQLDHRDCNVDRFAAGVERFTVGLAKKLLLANGFGQLWELCKASQALSVGGAWLGVLGFSLQIYFDFSGYSDMAIGLGRMLGFEFPENFRYPYIARSVTDFWRRWHISLSSWFRDYLYIPLGGNRCSKPRWICNLFLVWAATGIWHGASWNYLLWGLYYFCWLLLEKLLLGKLLERLPALLQHLYLIGIVMVGWAIFALEDFGQLHSYLALMFGFGSAPLWSPATSYLLRNYLCLLGIGLIGATPLAADCFRRLPELCRVWLSPLLLVLGLLWSTAYLVAGTYNPFLYFRF
ncbi:MAG: MBOAT family protein [Oscillospiraceae bacterium]|nr:MBOAT family protein [Oscillospiraceae bacterium]